MRVGTKDCSVDWELCNLAQLSLLHSAIPRPPAPAAPKLLFLLSFMNRTPRYLNSFTWGKVSLPGVCNLSVPCWEQWPQIWTLFYFFLLFISGQSHIKVQVKVIFDLWENKKLKQLYFIVMSASLWLNVVSTCIHYAHHQPPPSRTKCQSTHTQVQYTVSSCTLQHLYGSLLGNSDSVPESSMLPLNRQGLA